MLRLAQDQVNYDGIADESFAGECVARRNNFKFVLRTIGLGGVDLCLHLIKR